MGKSVKKEWMRPAGAPMEAITGYGRIWPSLNILSVKIKFKMIFMKKNDETHLDTALIRNIFLNKNDCQ